MIEFNRNRLADFLHFSGESLRHTAKLAEKGDAPASTVSLLNRLADEADTLLEFVECEAELVGKFTPRHKR